MEVSSVFSLRFFNFTTWKWRMRFATSISPSIPISPSHPRHWSFGQRKSNSPRFRQAFPHCLRQVSWFTAKGTFRKSAKDWTTCHLIWFRLDLSRLGSVWHLNRVICLLEQKSLLPSAPEKQTNNETPWLSAKHVSTAATAPRKSVWGSSIVVSNHPCNPQQRHLIRVFSVWKPKLRSEGANHATLVTPLLEFFVVTLVCRANPSFGWGIWREAGRGAWLPVSSLHSKLETQRATHVHHPSSPPSPPSDLKEFASSCIPNRWVRGLASKLKIHMISFTNRITISHESWSQVKQLITSQVALKEWKEMVWIESGSLKISIKFI